jgi:regulator of protease activity HflC (stomatin/prohibitin superfamily)
VFLLITGSLIALVGLVVFLGAKRKPIPEEPERRDYEAHEHWKYQKRKIEERNEFVGAAKVIGVGVLLLGLLLAGLSTLTSVPARNVGVVTSFGKVSGRTLEPGLHLKAPWQKVQDMNGTVQQIDNLGDRKTAIRLNTQSEMFVENVVRWKIRPQSAADLYQDWTDNKGDIVENRVGPGLVEKEIAASINAALAGYDPLNPTRKNTDQLSADVRNRLVGPKGDAGTIGNKIELVTFQIIKVDFDGQTQARIVNYQEEVARTKQAAQRVATAQQEKLANDKIKASVSNDPNVLVNKCLDTHARIVEKGGSLTGVPPCWPINGVQSVRPVQ